jgi:hypothetical protein
MLIIFLKARISNVNVKYPIRFFVKEKLHWCRHWEVKIFMSLVLVDLLPPPETVVLVEDIVVEYVTDLRLSCSAGISTVVKLCLWFNSSLYPCTAYYSGLRPTRQCLRPLPCRPRAACERRGRAIAGRLLPAGRARTLPHLLIA